METQHTSNVSLIDLSAQLPFEIDDTIKQELCFVETLIISCGDFDGEREDSFSDSECYDTTVTSETSPEVAEQPPVTTEDLVEEPPPPVDEEDKDFYFFFYPDCKKPLPPQHSRTSVLIEDGLPKINPSIKEQKLCTCDRDKRGKCTCYVHYPCKCGAKTKLECTCLKEEEICICHDGEPMPVCLCKGSDVCVCHPDGIPRPVCTCDLVDKPCICHPGKYASPVCTCKQKPCICDLDNYPLLVCPCNKEPKPYSEEIESITELPEEHYTEEGISAEDSNEATMEDTNEATVEDAEEGLEKGTEKSADGEIGENIVASSSSGEPCDCQKPDPPPPQCFCLKGRKCVCKGICICEIRPPCVCEQTSSQSFISCATGDSKTICDCTKPCTCGEDPKNCKCFATPQKFCTCGDPYNCKCFKSCTCEAPCTCIIASPTPEECICLDQSLMHDPKDEICTCEHTKGEGLSRKIKRQAKQEGYRWCNDVDPRHTYFDYAYGRHDKVDYKEQERERFKLLGLIKDEVAEVNADEGVCPVHDLKAPPTEKKVMRPSLNCCSAVGRISISVETLGEDKDKFLVQVVSNSTKEGIKFGSKLVGILDCNLHTLEENRTEHIMKRDKLLERRSYLAICDSGYFNKVTRICGERKVVKRLYHDFDSSRDFLLEAANVIFLRYISLRRYSGYIRTETVIMDGKICESIYACMGVSEAVINNAPLSVVKVERHIIEPSGSIHQTFTVLTVKGHIVSHEWADNCYICHLNPLLRIIPEKDKIEPHAPLRSRWREDLQLLSDYENFKSSRFGEFARFLSWSTALTSILRDYLQSVLLLRPKDTLPYTRHYFASALSALELPHDQFFDPENRNKQYYFFEK